jgi:nitrogen regulatory protein PII 2
MITLTVTDEKADLAIQTIIKANQTGNSGDGKIFVLPTADAVQVRTGDSGDKVLD